MSQTQFGSKKLTSYYNDFMSSCVLSWYCLLNITFS